MIPALQSPIDVFPIIVPSIDWDTLLKQGYNLLGRSISRNVEDRKFDLKTFGSALSLIKAIELPKHDPTLLQGNCLDHLSFSFLVMASPQGLTALIQSSKLPVIVDREKGSVGIVSGRLLEWKHAIIEGSIDFEARVILNRCHLFLEQAGLSGVWKDYSKNAINDGTYTLTL